jgi:phosphatidylserine/phosphatidylglycerophosphate/cardiolipin synthase-like enzyme
MLNSSPLLRVHFGGPDRPAGALAGMLRSRIDAVPEGGEIHWITYYFGNVDLARALLEAKRRGVVVRLDIEARPRRGEVNAEVLRLLDGKEGLAEDVRAIRHVLPCHVHEKLYYFSHPAPVVYLGSYNPSRGAYDSPELLGDIGDQDRGHNFLVEITAAPPVAFLRAHLHAMHHHRHGMFERFRSDLNAAYESSDLAIWLFPRRSSGVVPTALRRAAADRIRIAASHFRDGSMARLLASLAGRGVKVEILAHDTLRRMPRRVERTLRSAGIAFTRYAHAEGLPMHNKFMLLEGKSERSTLFGSFNLTKTSKWLNHEILLESHDPGLYSAFARRWNEMMAQAEAQGGSP